MENKLEKKGGGGMKIWLCVIILAVSLIIPAASFCQQDQDAPRMQSKEGVVTQVDSVGSLLVVSDGIEMLRFNVDQDTKIQRGVDNIMLDDLESDDPVNVNYYKTPDGVLKAVLITDGNIISSF